MSLLHAAMNWPRDPKPLHASVPAVGIHQRHEAARARAMRTIAHAAEGARYSNAIGWVNVRERGSSGLAGRQGKRSDLLARGLSSARLVAATVSISHCLTPSRDSVARQPRTVRRREGSRRSAASKRSPGCPICCVRLKWWRRAGHRACSGCVGVVRTASGLPCPTQLATPIRPHEVRGTRAVRATRAHAAGRGAQSALYGPS